MSGMQAETVRFLSRAESYGAVGSVERIETHAAIVFLIGDLAYKLKRAVKFPFLDYRTADLRRRACQAELVLNRRTAPELYVDVRSVNRSSDGRLSLTEQGEAVDWLVVMRRFEQNMLLDHMADQGTLSPALLRKLSDNIALFHARAEVTADRGGAAAIRAVIELNYRCMVGHETILPKADVEALRQRSLIALSAVATILDRRRAEGFVRRCHGDLHLRNICVVAGEPTPFDCIEFNDDLACIDILYDLAFLLMDLWHRGHAAAANLVFNRYFDMNGGANDGLVALPLFLSMRAAVRAHVSAAAAAGQSDQAIAGKQREAARNYLEHAARLLDPQSPSLIAIGGLSGTGKSTLAYALAPSIGNPPGARVLRSDVIRKRLMNQAPESPLPEDAYSRETTVKVYTEIYKQSAVVLTAGHAVIADAVFAKHAERTAISAVAHAKGTVFKGLWLNAPVSKLARRLANRVGDASDATPAILAQQLHYEIGPLEDWEPLNAEGDAASTLDAATKILASARRHS